MGSCSPEWRARPSSSPPSPTLGPEPTSCTGPATSLLQSDQDREVPARRIDELHRLRPDAERVVKKGRHLLPQARPTKAAAAIVRFVATVAG